MFMRFVSVCTLNAALFVLGNFSGLPSARFQSLPQNAAPRAVSERKLNKIDWPRMPVKVNSARLKRGSAVFGEAFADPDDDWLEGLAINVENTSTKPIVHIDVSLTFFKKEEGLVPERVPVAFPIFYGSGLGTFNTGRTFQPVKPGESVDVVFSTDNLLQLKAMLVEDKYPLSFHQVDVCVEAIQFDDGELWYKSYIFYRDPYNPNRYVRDKYFKKGGKYEGIKPGTILN
jgi:hypothetical protein